MLIKTLHIIRLINNNTVYYAGKRVTGYLMEWVKDTEPRCWKSIKLYESYQAAQNAYNASYLLKSTIKNREGVVEIVECDLLLIKIKKQESNNESIN